MSQSKTSSLIETITGTLLSVACAQIILTLNDMPIGDALRLNLEIVVVSTIIRYFWRRLFNGRY